MVSRFFSCFNLWKITSVYRGYSPAICRLFFTTFTFYVALRLCQIFCVTQVTSRPNYEVPSPPPPISSHPLMLTPTLRKLKLASLSSGSSYSRSQVLASRLGAIRPTLVRYVCYVQKVNH